MVKEDFFKKSTDSISKCELKENSHTQKHLTVQYYSWFRGKDLLVVTCGLHVWLSLTACQGVLHASRETTRALTTAWRVIVACIHNCSDSGEVTVQTVFFSFWQLFGVQEKEEKNHLLQAMHSKYCLCIFHALIVLQHIQDDEMKEIFFPCHSSILSTYLM